MRIWTMRFHSKRSASNNKSPNDAAIGLVRSRRVVRRRAVSAVLHVAWGVFCAKHGRLLSSGAREGGIRSRCTGETARGRGRRDGVVSRVPGAVFPLAAAADGERRRVVVENNERGYATAQENVHFQRVCTDWEHGSLFVAESSEEKLNECHRDEEGYFYILQLKTERLSGDVEIFWTSIGINV